MANRTYGVVAILVVLFALILTHSHADAAVGTLTLRDTVVGWSFAQVSENQAGGPGWIVPSLSLRSAPPTGQVTLENSPVSLPEWVEPRGLSIADLVGQIPDEYLRGMIISYGPSTGIVVYESGSRVGNTVVVTATIYPRIHTPIWPPHNLVTQFGCLGQTPFFDHIGSVVPASTMRVYLSDGTDVTEQVQFMDISRLGLEQPIANSQSSIRYPVEEYGLWKPFPLPMGPEGLQVPTNGGCIFEQPGVDNYPLTGVFTFTVDVPPEVSVVGTQQATFQSFIGSSDVGIFQPLMNQLQGQYGDRHTRIPLSPPDGASYFLVRFPPMPGDPYTDRVDGILDNADRPTGGTYRLSTWVYLSTDLIYSGALPLYPAWQDADRAPDAEFLPLMPPPVELAAPEYVIPAGMAYDSCFTQGNCPPTILEQIYHAEMVLDIFYLAMAMPQEAGEWIPLRMAGPRWQPSTTGGQSAPESLQPPSDDGGTLSGLWSEQVTAAFAVYFPLVAGSSGPEDPGECPCGWFDSLGRMLYYHP